MGRQLHAAVQLILLHLLDLFNQLMGGIIDLLWAAPLLLLFLLVLSLQLLGQFFILALPFLVPLEVLLLKHLYDHLSLRVVFL